MNVNGVDRTPKSCNVINDCHLYVSDDHENDTLFIQHCFGLIYESFRKKLHIIQNALDFVGWVCREVEVSMQFLLVELASQGESMHVLVRFASTQMDVDLINVKNIDT